MSEVWTRAKRRSRRSKPWHPQGRRKSHPARSRAACPTSLCCRSPCSRLDRKRWVAAQPSLPPRHGRGICRGDVVSCAQWRDGAGAAWMHAADRGQVRPGADGPSARAPGKTPRKAALSPFPFASLIPTYPGGRTSCKAPYHVPQNHNWNHCDGWLHVRHVLW